MRDLPRLLNLLIVGVLASSGLPAAVNGAEDSTPDYVRDVAPVFAKYCAGCHNAKESEGGFRVDSVERLIQGGDNGKAIVPGKADMSRLVKMIEKKLDPQMPPEDKPQPTAREIAAIRRWVDAGAKGSGGKVSGSKPAMPLLPQVAPRGQVRRPVTGVAWSPDGKLLAIARYKNVEIRDAASERTLKLLKGHAGNVNDVHFSRDGKVLAVAAGETGVSGEATIWSTADWSRRQTLRGSADSLYAIEISPDGTLLATAGYDQKITLWKIGVDKPLQVLNGHNGAIFDLAFHPNGRILASASGDRTVKLWSIPSGERLDTLIQPEKDQYAVAFRPDGKHLAAGGVDNRIRIWEITAGGKEGTNPLLYSRFAHESAILRLLFLPEGRGLVSTGEDRMIKLWTTTDYTQRKAMSAQPDWVVALAADPGANSLLVGRLDGSLEKLPLDAGIGRNHQSPGAPMHETSAAGRWRGEKLPATPNPENEPNDVPAQSQRAAVPAWIAGTFRVRSQTGNRTTINEDADCFRFQAKRGEALVIETKAEQIKSKADTRIEILHPDGRPVLRKILRAVRDSEVTFRPIDSRSPDVRLKNWEEMALNQYLYMNGEVCRLFRKPQGPDSGYQLYFLEGKRRAYFDTTPISHALFEPAYIVEALAPGASFVENGLPTFPLHYANDDDADRKLGSDSRLHFVPDAEGEYVVRVSETSGSSGTDYSYQLIIRHAQPGYKVSISPRDFTVPAGSGQKFTLNVDRIDGFDGPVTVRIENLPQGITIPSPIVVEAGHLSAQGVIRAEASLFPAAPPVVKPDTAKQKVEPAKKSASDKKSDPAKSTVKKGAEAPAILDVSKVRITTESTTPVEQGSGVVTAGIASLKVVPRAKIVVHLELESLKPGANSPAGEGTGSTSVGGSKSAATDSATRELIIVPGTSVTAKIRVERHGFDGDIQFTVENLPHGLIVDNIGLSGVLVRASETQRVITLTADEWVSPTTRSIFALANREGNQTSAPILLRVVSPSKTSRTR